MWAGITRIPFTVEIRIPLIWVNDPRTVVELINAPVSVNQFDRWSVADIGLSALGIFGAKPDRASRSVESQQDSIADLALRSRYMATDQTNEGVHFDIATYVPSHGV
ncbi:MAG: hypothetical protein RLN78_12665 [Phycisphaerales bacterium]